VLACQNLGQHILALGGGQEVFDEVFHLLFKTKDLKAKNHRSVP
jgi:hypothetical protein